MTFRELIEKEKKELCKAPNVEDLLKNSTLR